MNWLHAWHRRALERAGLIVMLADEVPLPIYDDESAVRYVRTLGYDVTRPQTVLAVGQCWRPSESGSRSRWVRSAGDQLMSYALTVDGWPVTIDRETWDRWVRRTKAVCS